VNSSSDREEHPTQRTSSGLSREDVGRLLTPHDGDTGAMALMLAGRSAIPALQSFLLKRERSGIYQPRCWAVDVLAALQAYDVLAAYLREEHGARDPVERAGNEAVVNAAARALSRTGQDWVFDLLLALARRHPSQGVIEALGAFDRSKAVPFLIDALAEDDCRIIAEGCLRRVADVALPALVEAALRRRPSAANESETSLRQRRSALGLLGGMALSEMTVAAMRSLMEDPDTRIAVLACGLCVQNGTTSDKDAAKARLRQLLRDADWMRAREIEHFLTGEQR
jgi:hypothetical protein